ncbi:hypothetical protein LJR130_006962 [Variovorax sp. LjRoot130]|uniref:hypothetical protein n=1 Tax=Variovorax sp. LjRoot130 TaxID=3342261 RepID=UPI003ECD26B5
MATQTFRNSRRRRNARRTHQNPRPQDPQGTPHDQAIRRLTLELRAREGLMGLFHAGVTWRALACLVDLSRPVVVEHEKSIKIGSSRFVPDLVVRCPQTDRILLVIEVWHTHAVSGRKKAAFQAAGFPWIEVRSWHVISRYRRRPLPVLDWGGAGLPIGPEQFGLFDLIAPELCSINRIYVTSQTALLRPRRLPACGLLPFVRA